jgi:hypothetical protein
VSEILFDELVVDSQLAETYDILRSNGGNFAPGGFKDSKQQIPNYGIVTPASSKDLSMLPEGDEIHEARAFYSNIELFETNASNTQVSDILQWGGNNYRILKVLDQSNRGFWKAIAVRMAGS